MLRIELLTSRHTRKGFDCGEAALDDYLKRHARQHIEKGISKTFVLIDTEKPTEIIGFFTLASCEVVTDNLPGKLRKIYPGSAQAAKLARLAVSTKYQRQGLGSILMIEAMKRVMAVAEHIGIIGFFVNAKSHAARKYYEQFGFISLPDHPLDLFLPLKTLEEGVNAAAE